MPRRTTGSSTGNRTQRTLRLPTSQWMSATARMPPHKTTRAKTPIATMQEKSYLERVVLSCLRKRVQFGVNLKFRDMAPYSLALSPDGKTLCIARRGDFVFQENFPVKRKGIVYTAAGIFALLSLLCLRQGAVQAQAVPALVPGTGDTVAATLPVWRPTPVPLRCVFVARTKEASTGLTVSKMIRQAFRQNWARRWGERTPERCGERMNGVSPTKRTKKYSR